MIDTCYNEMYWVCAVTCGQSTTHIRVVVDNNLAGLFFTYFLINMN